MRRLIFFSLGVLEALAAGVLVLFAFTLPTPRDVNDKAERDENVSQAAGDQVKGLRGQLKGIRERQPQLKDRAERLNNEMRQARRTLDKQTPDEATRNNMS